MNIRSKDDMVMHCTGNVDADGAYDDDDCAGSGEDDNDDMDDDFMIMTIMRWRHDKDGADDADDIEDDNINDDDNDNDYNHIYSDGGDDINDAVLYM